MRAPSVNCDENSAFERINEAPETDRLAVIVKGGKRMGIVIPNAAD